MKKIAIIGLGYSGFISAYELLTNIDDIQVDVFDGSGSNARGHAYSTKFNSHVLNVPAVRMSAYATQPDNFINWLKANQLVDDSVNLRQYFAPRKVFGDYLNEQLNSLKLKYADTLKILPELVVNYKRSGEKFILTTQNGSVMSYDMVILANGNAVDFDLLKCVSPCYISNPWNYHALNVLANAKHVGVIGSGLTMVDIVLSLLEIGFKGKITALSRHGGMPIGHKFASHEYTDFMSSFIQRDSIEINELLSLVRKEINSCNGDLAKVQSVIALLHPYTQRIWQKMDLKNQKRFMRHLRPHWDVIRHKIAPCAMEQLDGLFQQNRLEIIAGRIDGVELSEDRIKLNYITRTEHVKGVMDCDYLVNATGLSGNLNHLGVLFRQLLKDEVIKNEKNGLGMSLDKNDQVMNQANLFVVGPLTRSKYWENIAIPDIRNQVNNLVKYIKTSI